jgi:uncharacterized protein
VACRRVGDKQGLVRVVKTAANSLDIDLTGKKAGRGAYLCRLRRCWEVGIKGGKLEQTLHISLQAKDRDAIMEKGQALFEEKTIG